MYRIFLVLVLMSQLTAVAAARTIVTQTPVYNYPYYNHPNSIGYNYANPRHYYPKKTQFDDINALEKYSLNKSYSRESDIQRLERLEMQAFGAVRQGDLNLRYNNVRSAILSRPKQNYKTSILKGIGNYFSGQMTGFTPDITGYYPSSGFSYTPYPTTYNNSSIDQFSGPFGSGYRINNYSTGSSAGVKILD